MRVLVVGGYGLIGAHIVRTLRTSGHEVIGFGRSVRRGRVLAPSVEWRGADLTTLTDPAAWSRYLSGCDAVVNASGVLQSGLRDDVRKTQGDAIIALIRACEIQRVVKFIQISAPGAALQSDTAFYATKAMADGALTRSTLHWTIFRPGLVLSPCAYGGTSLLRALAAAPLVQPLLHGSAIVQTVHVGDVARAVVRAIDDDFSGCDFDLVAPQTMTLSALVLAIRQWLGFGRPVRVIDLPAFLGGPVAFLADVAGALGWRSPLRSTALRVLSANVTGDAHAWPTASGETPLTLHETLDHIPSTMQERIFARTALLFPFLVVVLGAFWIASGVIGIVERDRAMAVFDASTPPTAQALAVYGGAALDLLIGAALFVRPLTRWASLASIAVAIIYMIGGMVFAPSLWADPLGPMVKIIPIAALGLVVAALSEER